MPDVLDWNGTLYWKKSIKFCRILWNSVRFKRLNDVTCTSYLKRKIISLGYSLNVEFMTMTFTIIQLSCIIKIIGIIIENCTMPNSIPHVTPTMFPGSCCLISTGIITITDRTNAKAYRKCWLHSILDLCSKTPSFCSLTFSCRTSSNFTSRRKPTSYRPLLGIPILLRDPFSFKNQINFHTGSARWPKLLLGNSNSDTPFFLKL